MQRKHVAAGTFAIETQKPVILYACLASCVGVALYDPAERIGGLMHILLPSPPSADSTYNLESYAETGFPLFVQALLARGARQENLEACIAGGSLMGPVSQQDINLDIGGRTCDVVNGLLGQYGIRVKKTETGGFSPRTLSLDMSSFATAIIPAQQAPEAVSAKFKRPTAEDIRATVEHLLPIPQVALKIMRLLSEGRYNINDIVNEMQQDQVLVAKILKLCNSSMFSGNVQVNSLDKALLLLGQRMIVQMVISESVTSFYNQAHSGYSLCKGGLYQHAIGTAVIAEKIASATAMAPLSVAYTAGLLHDIGMVVLDQYIASAAPLFYRALDVENTDMLTVEKELLGVNHCEAGKVLAELWKLPPSLADAIYCHHFPEEAPGAPALPHIIYLADLIMAMFHSGLQKERLNTDKLHARMKVLGLSPADFSGLVDRVPLAVFSASPEAAIARK